MCYWEENLGKQIEIDLLTVLLSTPLNKLPRFERSSTAVSVAVVLLTVVPVLPIVRIPAIPFLSVTLPARSLFICLRLSKNKHNVNQFLIENLIFSEVHAESMKLIKFRYYEKETQIWKKSPNLFWHYYLTKVGDYLTNVKITWENLFTFCGLLNFTIYWNKDTYLKHLLWYKLLHFLNYMF